MVEPTAVDRLSTTVLTVDIRSFIAAISVHIILLLAKTLSLKKYQ